MKFKISKDWCIEKAKAEVSENIGAGVLGIDPIFEADEGRIEILHESRLALGRFVELNRRHKKLTIEALAEKADVEISELLRIEHGRLLEPETRTLYQIAVVFGVDHKKLMGLSGLTKSKDTSFIEDAVKYAARSESLEDLSEDEQAALDGLISVLASK